MGIQEADIVYPNYKVHYDVDVLAEILPVTITRFWRQLWADLSIENLQNKIGASNSAIRIMPNIASQFGVSATCIAFHEKDREKAQK
jgi:pyrroline-5-carboxylate reductase